MIILLIFAFIALIAYIIWRVSSQYKVESFSDNEALQNISSLYNSNKLTTTELVTNRITGSNGQLDISGTVNAGNIKATNISANELTSPALTQLKNDVVNIVNNSLVRSYAQLTAQNTSSNQLDRHYLDRDKIVDIIPATFYGKNFSKVTNGSIKYTGPSGKNFSIMGYVGLVEGDWYKIVIRVNNAPVAQALADGAGGLTAHAIISTIQKLNTNDQIDLYNTNYNDIQVECYFIQVTQVD